MIEFEPFKFNNEKLNLARGYTLEELYGRKYILLYFFLFKL
jgi:hypothetical protein